MVFYLCISWSFDLFEKQVGGKAVENEELEGCGIFFLQPIR